MLQKTAVGDPAVWVVKVPAWFLSGARDIVPPRLRQVADALGVPVADVALLERRHLLCADADHANRLPPVDELLRRGPWERFEVDLPG